MERIFICSDKHRNGYWTTIVIGVGAYLAISGSITVGTLAAFVGYLEQLFGPLRRLVSSFTTLTQSFASMDRVFN